MKRFLILFLGAVRRGVNGGGLPWQIAEGRGELASDGRLEVEVRGLVLLDGPPVPLALRGTNPISSFRAIVSCLTIVDGGPATGNVATGPFPATATGDSKIGPTKMIGAKHGLGSPTVPDDVVRRDGYVVRKH